jgi:predicted NBD/HSP70 family sugar kinase
MEAKRLSAMNLGIDWGGTKIEIAALDDSGQEQLRSP